MKGLNLSRASELSQVIGAVAVVVSLIYVGVEVRQNTLATKAAMRQSIADNDIEFLITNLDNSIIAVANAKMTSNDSLSFVEWDQLVRQQQVNFRVFENAHYQYMNGLLEDEVWSRYRIIIFRLLSGNEAAIRLWRNSENTFTSSFRKSIGEIMSDEQLKLEVSE